jgi:hypothetical protein
MLLPLQFISDRELLQGVLHSAAQHWGVPIRAFLDPGILIKDLRSRERLRRK